MANLIDKLESKKERNKTIFDRLVLVVKSCDLSDEKAKITMDSTLEVDLGMDSLDKYEFIFRVEEEFDVDIPDRYAHEFKSVGDYMDYLKEHYKG